jgi:tetratricopeptide (TPR) repeat protein
MTTLAMALRELFDAALALPPGERAAFLDAQCPDPQARARLERLLVAAVDADTDGGDVLPTQPAERLAAAIGDIEVGHDWTPGRTIGPYLLVEILGEGGSATVFRAERDLDGVRQQVALKLLHRGLYSPESQRLFRRERQALASLSHPNIAHLIDGGVTDSGHAYLVMEYVDGQPVTEYAARQQLDVNARLRLLAVVCRAVAAAHRALIVHRDLKPSNILVDDDGRVKLLDFGIAKLLGEDLDEAGTTRTGYAPLTPGYAAPEQYSGGAISTATDVYALGVVLHELLLGERPARNPVQRPSARVADLPTDMWALPAPRPVLRAALRGDLDTIVLKALAEEPARRYASAADLAEDIDRHLDHRPVQAHPPSRWYRTRKFVQRHRGGVAVTAALALAVIASLGVALWQAQVARQEARRANEQSQLAQNESRRANEVRNFVQGLFESINEGFPEHRTPSVRDLVAAGVERLRADREFGLPERLDLLMMFARLHERLGEPEPARALADEAVALSGAGLDRLHPRAIEALALRGDLAVRIGDLAAAEAPLREALDRLRASRLDSPLLHEVLESLANIESAKGNAETSLTLAQESLAGRIRLYGADSVGAAAGHNNVGVGLFGLGRFEEAAEAYRLTYEIDARHQAVDSYYVLFSLSNWAHAMGEAGRIRESRKRLVDVEDALRRLGGNPRQGQVVNRLRLCLLDAQFALAPAAEASCRDLLAIAEAFTGGQGNYMIASLRTDAVRHREAGDLEQSARLLERAAALLGDDPTQARFQGTILAGQAALAWLSGQAGAVHRLASDGLADLDRFPHMAATATELRALLALACANDGAAPCPPALLPALDAALADPRARGNGNYLLAATLRLRGRIADGAGAAGLAAFDSVFAGSAAELGDDHPLVAAARLWRARALAADGACGAADAEIRLAAAGTGPPGRDNPWLRQAIDAPTPDCPAD